MFLPQAAREVSVLTSRLEVVAAAAGSGKTTRLVQTYLSLLKSGLSPSRIIAITFTRKAAAALIEKVSHCLQIAHAAHPSQRGDWSPGLMDPLPHIPPQANLDATKGDLDTYMACFEAHVPTQLSHLERCQQELMNAPVGTTDSFIHELLSEFALWARLPAGQTEGVPLDIPIMQGDAMAAFHAAARELIDGPGGVPDAARLLLEHMTLGELLDRVAGMAKTVHNPGPGVWLSAGEIALQILEVAAPLVREACLAEPKLYTAKPTKNMTPHHDPVVDWLEGGAQGQPPHRLLPWVAAVAKRSGKHLDPLKDALADAVVDFGVARLSLAAALACCHDLDPALLKQANAVRDALFQLAATTRPRALELAARGGTLDYDLLAEAAIHLCESPPQRLLSRFDALLVDEVQDANATQERLYQALESVIATAPDTHSSPAHCRVFYVGDARQSIYLFRGAEPQVFDRLMARAHQTGALNHLNFNYRSAPGLVEATKTLFALAGDALEGLHPIDEVQARPSTMGRTLSPHPDPTLSAPVVLVTANAGTQWSVGEMNDAALEVFVQRVIHAWTDTDAAGVPSGASDDAVVLTTSWADARHACDRLAMLLADAGLDPDLAVLDGQRNLTGTRVCRDAWLLLRALWDANDDIAWVGLWKHPMFGLSDGALANFRDGGVGLLGGWGGALSGPSHARGLDPAHYIEADVASFQRCIGPLRGALQDIGTRSTADVLETLASALRWRPILAAGPDGEESVAQLEVVLDWVRAIEDVQVDPGLVIQTLADDGSATEAPRLEITRGAGTISCTTVYQSKGLEWDHVFVYSIGKLRTGSRRSEWPLTQIMWHGVPRWLAGVNLDPAGGLDPRKGLVTQVADALDKKRASEERLRLAYVALTRARRSVTLGLLPGSRVSGIHPDLADAWLNNAIPDVHIHAMDNPTPMPGVSPGHAVALRPFPPVPTYAPDPQNGVAPGIALVTPSKAGKDWTPAQRQALAAQWQAKAEFLAGGQPFDPPRTAATEHWAPWHWGELMHGWLAHVGLVQQDADTQAFDYVRQTLQAADNEVVGAWLSSTVRRLWKLQPEFLAGLFASDVTLHFEVPFIGHARGARNEAEESVYTGRIDLLVERPNKRCWVLDFKAGDRGPKDRDALVEDGNIETYGPQLEAYRAALEGAGWTVERVGLIWVRYGAIALF